MRSGLVTSLLVVLVLAAGAPPRARACGSAPEPNWTLTGSLPEDGAVDVPRDLGIVLFGQAWGDEPAEAEFDVTFASAVGSVHLLEAATGTEVPIRGISWMSHRPSAAWHPDAPLAPRTVYRVEAELRNQATMPPEVTGPTRLTFTFTTGDDFAPPLETTGNLAMELEGYDRPVFTNCGPCGDGREAAGTVRDIRARVILPALRGGVDDDGYRGWLAVRTDAPATFDATGEPNDGAGWVGTVYVPIAPGAPMVVHAPLRDVGHVYLLCALLGAWDPAGHLSRPEPVCIDETRRSDLLATEVATSGGASCAVTPRASPGMPWGAPLALAFAAARLRKRSRRTGTHAG